MKMVSLGCRTGSLIVLHFGCKIYCFPAKKRMNIENNLVFMDSENKIVHKSATKVIQKLITKI